VHPNWRDVLAADIAVVHAHADRYRDVPWVGVAAAAEPSEPNIDELVDMLRHRLADDALARRNRLRAWEVRLRGAVRRCCDDAAAADARLAELHEQRREAVRRRRLAKSDRTVALRSQIEQARVQLSYFARNRCTSVRGELVDDAAAATRQKLPAFEDYVRNRVDDVVTEVNSGVTDHLRDMAAELGLTAPAGAPPPTSPPVPSPALRSGNQETRRIMPLGPRGLRHDRAVLERWVSDVVTELRTTVDALVAERVLAAETTLTAELAVLDEAQAADLAERLAAIDAELRQQGLNAARAAATRNRDLPAFQSALEHVRGELNGS
jgi:hypothetical protein